jgi:hypothetical protein
MGKLTLFLTMAIALCFSTVGMATNYNTDCAVRRSLEKHSHIYANRKVVADFQYQNIVKEVIVKAIAVPVTDFHADYYYKLERGIDEEALAEKIAERVGQKLDYFASKIAEELRKAPVTTLPPDDEPEPEPEEPETTSIEVPVDVSALLEKYNCASCHDATEKKTKFWNFASMTRNDKPFTIADWWRISDAVESGRMPKSNKKMSDTESKLIEAWVRKVDENESK